MTTWLRLRFCLLALAGLEAGLPAPPARAQAADSLATLARPLRRYNQRVLVEKLYGHLDRPAYVARETLWLQLYAVDGTSHQPLALSTVAYVEVLNNLGQPVLQTQLPLRGGAGHGSLVLPAALPTGRYVVRAYTSWMKNFDPEFYFHATITVVNTFAGAAPAAPVALAAPARGYDVQFFPEGGQLVQGVPGRVAFRVADAAGRGQAATGTVRDAQGRAVATLRTLQPGLGSFELLPAAGIAYSADIQVVGGPRLQQVLPAAAAQGYALRLSEAGPGQLRLRVVGRGVGPAAPLALLAHAGQRVAPVQVAQPDAQGAAEFVLDKAALPAGLAHLTVFDSHRRPVGERLYFRRPRLLPLAVAAPAVAGPRTRVTLRLTLPADASPASASLAVYQLDSLATATPLADIASVLSLTADLKGTVENPDYYLRDSSQVGQAALDNLLLTHGWSRFAWAAVLAGAAPALPYPPELRGPLVRGRVTTATGAPAPGILTYLAVPGRAARFYPATSDADGVVTFEPKDWVGPQALTLQTDWRRDSTYQLALLSPYSARYAPGRLPPLALSPALAADLTRRHQQAQLATAYFGRYQQYQRPPRDTIAFYGRAPAQYRLDDFTRFKVLEEVLTEYVQGVYVRQRPDGFHLQLSDPARRGMFAQDPLVLLDGVPVFHLNQLMAFDPLRIQRVDLFANRYFYGGQEYEGLLSFKTYQGDLQGFTLDPRTLLEEIDGVQGQREFFAPRYDTSQQQQSPLPDQRNLLHWQPAIALQPNVPQELSFYTSDQAARYQVVVQGLGANGQAGTARAVIEVKPAL